MNFVGVRFGRLYGRFRLNDSSRFPTLSRFRSGRVIACPSAVTTRPARCPFPPRLLGIVSSLTIFLHRICGPVSTFLAGTVGAVRVFVLRRLFRALSTLRLGPVLPLGRVALVLTLIGAISAVLALRITVINVHDPVIMFRMLVHVLGGDSITGRIRITG